MGSFEGNISVLKGMFKECDDFVFQNIQIASKKGCLFYLKEMVDNQTLLKVEQGFSSYIENHKISSVDTFQTFIHQQFPFSILTVSAGSNNAAENILAGNTVLIVDGLDQLFIFQTKKYARREITEPTTEPTIKGPKEGFVEDIETNLLLIRKRIRTSSLKVEHLTLGEQTHTKICVVYLKGIADDQIVKEVHERLSRIKIDGVLESQYIESMISDAPKSPFPTVYTTERPDRVCGSLLDGKVAIFIDGAPFVITVPVMFVEFLHSGDDYYTSPIVATAVRWIRFLGLFVTLILPAFYVALTTFHHDLLQTPLLIRIAASREALPYPAVVEAIFLVITYELLREAGIRMPRTLGSGIVTVLGLVLIGQSAVQAGIIGPVMAIVISVSALTSFILPNYQFHQIIRFSGLPILILAGLFGFMGILVALMFGLTHLVSLRSFGVPYFSPVSPARKEGWKDVFIRAPWWAMDTRAPGLDSGNQYRAGDDNYANPSRNQKEKKDE
jgi:hypothetical protein